MSDREWFTGIMGFCIGGALFGIGPRADGWTVVGLAMLFVFAWTSKRASPANRTVTPWKEEPTDGE